MPSSSAAQHRWIGWLHSNPEARKRSGMSESQVSEWLHADRGSPWKHKADGGYTPGAGGYTGMGPWQPTQGTLPDAQDAPPLATPSAGSIEPYLQALEGVTAQFPIGNNAGPAAQQQIQQAQINPNSLGHSGGGAVDMALQAAHAMAGQPRQHFQFGGMSMSQMMPYWAREANREEIHEAGLLQNEIPGRTDHLPVSVAAGSYVVPADVVAGLGEGNTLSGSRVLNHALKTGPYGTNLPQLPRHDTIPHTSVYHPLPEPPRPYIEPRERPGEGENVGEGEVYAEGGHVKGMDVHGKKNTVPIMAAGGEYVIPPHVVAHHPKLGGLDPHETDPKKKEQALKRGHDVLDAWVKMQRKKHIETLKKLPGPSK